MKPTVASIDKEAVCWSLAKHPDDSCGSFTREAILACAPPTSGVYGLFNLDCQILIGESANIQKTLLHHESETDFQSRHLRPTGFTFEPCAAELRKTKADELIARFLPMLQSEAALSETWSLSNAPMMSEAGLGGQEVETYAYHQEFPFHERERRRTVRRRYYFTHRQGAALATMFVASAAVIFYLGTIAGKNIQKRVNGAGGKPDVHASASISNRPLRIAAIRPLAAETADVQAVLAPAKTNPIVHSVESADLSKKWSVQVSATPAKDIADSLVQNLKASGHDGYVVEAEVKGQTYYRVRVGHFAARDQAESVRQSLVHQEEYRDAYITGD